ncbi:trypsin-like peptidase domain-containing protein [Enterococcus rotai]|uniref:trypsin-like peptidase domain-containing protein n=1 Tax=Enterococcus rotai TaxID=118060 RepID=UPI0035C737E4
MKQRKFSILGLLLVIFFINLAGPSTIVSAEEANSNTRAILPNNDRVQIKDATQEPYQTVCFIYVNNATQGSGVVIGKNAILTNRHVAVAAKNGDASNIKVNVARTSNSEFKGTFYGEEIKYSPDGQDLAIVYLKSNTNGQNIGDLVTPAKYVNNPVTTVGTSIRVIGYPGDKPWATMWESKGASTTETTNRIYYNASTFGGNSGSPVFNDQNEVIGIHFGAVSGENMAVRFKSSIYEFIRENIEPQKINLMGIGVQGKGEFARISLEIGKDRQVTIHKSSKYAFNPYFGNEVYASIKITKSDGTIVYDQDWKGNQGVANYGQDNIDLEEGSIVEIYHAEGINNRYNTSDDSELKPSNTKRYIYKLVNRRLTPLEIDNQ